MAVNVHCHHCSIPTSWEAYRASPEPWLDLWGGFPGRKREGKKEGGSEILEVGKGVM